MSTIFKAMNFKQIILLIGASLLSAPILAASSTDAVNADLQGFIQVLQKPAPNLSDYQTYFGYNDSNELAFEWKACKDKGQNPALQKPECFQGIVTRWSKKDESASLFLGWLKTQLPASAKLALQSTQAVGQGKNEIASSRIQASLGDNILIFWRPSKEEDRTQYGHLVLIALNGVPMNILVQQAGDASVLTAMGLTPLLRPLTVAEQKAQEDQVRAHCAADPECTKRMAKQAKEHAEEEKENKARENLGMQYEIWCKENATECEQQKQTRTKLMAEREKLVTECDKNYQHCLPEVAKWLKEQQAQLKPFCDRHKKECTELDQYRSKHDSEQQAWCKSKPLECAKVQKGIDRALMEVRAKEVGNAPQKKN